MSRDRSFLVTAASILVYANGESEAEKMVREALQKVGYSAAEFDVVDITGEDEDDD